MRTLVPALLLLTSVLTANPAMADRLTIDRIYGDPALEGAAPRGLKIAPDGSRVGFLKGRADDQNQLDLWSYNLADNSTRRLVDSRKLVPDEKLSDVEKARRERARTANFHGILDYEWSPDGQSLLFPLGGALYLLRLDQPDTPRKLTDGGVIDPKISPQGRYVSFVRDQNLHVIDLNSGDLRQLTQDGGGTIHNAQAEFVAQEEMDQSSGYWWAPNDSAIAFKRYDEAPVPIVKRFEVYADRTEVIEQRYPAAGDHNALLSLGLVSPQGGAVHWIDLGRNTDIYLPRVDWLPDSSALSFQRQSRDQKTLALIRVDVGSLRQKTLVTEHAKSWINLHRDLHFLESRAQFVWASERTGYKHLYLYANDGTLIRPLTQGQWQVDSLLAVDESTGTVYFDANKDAVIDRQLYAVPLDGKRPASPRRITDRDGTHEIEFAETPTLYVDKFSDPTTPPQVSVHAPDGKRLAWIEQNRLDDTHPYAPYLDSHVVPEFGQIKAEGGQTLWYRLLKPTGFDPAKRYPVVVYFYGGPTGQRATRKWTDPFSEFMAQNGYLVFTLDNRGTERRGRAFSDVIYRKLGDYEVRDQIAGIDWLRDQDFVDPKRIGVFGWSYGGYLSLMMLAKDSAQLAGGVAVAPVTDWTLYDTHYTERYLSTPQDNPAGYEKSAVFDWLDGLESPLLLIHGMADDNVLFLNSTQLMASLQARGIQFQLMTYPGGKHHPSTPAMKKHTYQAIYEFFEKTVKGSSAE